MIQGCGGTNPLKKKVAGKKKQEVGRVAAPRKKPAKSLWIESTAQKVVPESAGVKQDKPEGFVKAI